jgi:hypothetical protein
MKREIPSDIVATVKAERKFRRVRRKYGVGSPQFWAAKAEMDASYQAVDDRLYDGLD